MLKVMIIDDESLVRVGLKSMINWEELGFEIAGEAANGRIGLDLIMAHKPDIVLTDIKMPVMDGLEMMTGAVKLGFKPKFIILSSYDQFQLVKQAMKLGAEEYLIKLDLEPEILVNTLTAVRDKIVEEQGKSAGEAQLEKGLRENISMLREGFFKRMINRSVRDELEIKNQVKFLNIELNEDNLACAVIWVNNRALPDKYDADELRALENSILNTINEIINDVFIGYTLNWNLGEFVIVFSTDSEAPEKVYREKTLVMAERLIHVLKQYFNIPVSVGISNRFQGFPKLAAAFFEGCRAVQYGFYSAAKPVLMVDEVPEDKDNPGRFDFAEIREKLAKAIQTYDGETIHSSFQALVSLLKEENISRGNAFDICFQTAYLIGGSLGSHEAGLKEITGYRNSLSESIHSLNATPEIVGWMMNVEEGLQRFLSGKEEQKNHRLIAKAKKYILDHCSEEISLSETAAALGLSPSYLSTVFKQYTGTGFSDYVTENKMEEAKKLLRESDYKIYEISNMLGYQNAYYFSKVFKKATGMTPSEFAGKTVR